MGKILNVTTRSPFSWGTHLAKARLEDLPERGLTLTIPIQPVGRRITQIVAPPGTHVRLLVDEKVAASVDGVMPSELSAAVLILPMQAAHLQVTLDEKNRACLVGGPVGVQGFEVHEVE